MIKYCALFLMFLASHVFGQELSFSTYNERHGITHPYVYNIVQDKDGFLYFTTSEGAYSFDGLNFKRLDGAGLLKEPFFKSICLLNDRSTLLGSNTGGIFRINKGKVVWKYVSEAHTSPVNKIIKHKKDHFAFYQDGTVIQINPKGETKLYNLEPGFLYSSFSYIDGKFIAGVDMGFKFFTINNGTLKEQELININDDAVESICIYKKTIFFGTSSSGLYKYQEGKLSKMILGNEKIDNAQITAIFKDDLSSIWVAAFGDGVYELKRNTNSGAYYVRSCIDKEKGLPNQNVTSIFIDRETNLWLGSLGKGLSKLNSNSLIQYDLREFGYGNTVYSVYSGVNQLCGMKGGILEINSESDIITPWELNRSLPDDNITSIAYHYPSKTYYIGTAKNGMYSTVSNSNKLVKIDLSVDFLSKSINHINIQGNNIFISTMNGLYRMNIETNTLDHFSSKDGMPNNVIFSTFQKSDGKLLLGTRSTGIFYLERDKIREVKIENPYGLLEINNFAEDRRGQLWISTNGQGVFHLTDRQFNRMSSKVGLYSDFVYQMILDKKNTIWCGHRGGLSRVTDKEKVLDKFDYVDNITMDFLLNASSMDESNNVWFGTSEGALKFSILQDKFNVFNGHPVILDAMINDKSAANPSLLKFKDNQQNSVRFTFQTISLTFPGDVKYQYRLKGSRGVNNWSVESSENTATIGQLLYGDYELEVRSKIGNGDWSQGYILSKLEVAPPFYLKWWVICLMILGVFALIIGISYWRTMSLQSQKLALEEKLAIRTKEIENKNAKITQQFEEMQESIDYGVRIQNSLLPSISDLKSNIPESFLFFQPKDKVSGDFYYFEKFGNKLIVSVADATGHGVPGAFISLIGFVSLKEIIHRESTTRPDEALSELDLEINTTLGQYNRANDGKDGMDMAICEIDLDTKNVLMSSALRPIWLFRDGEFEKVRSSKSTVGGGVDSDKKEMKVFDFEERQLKKGDTIYMFTDGYVDQFGSERDKKLMSKRFLNLIKDNYELPMEDQGRIISKFLNDWKGNRDQTDDILVIGIRL